MFNHRTNLMKMRCLSKNALKRTGLSTGDMTSQEEVKQQRTRRNVLTSLPQSSEAVSGVSGSLPRSALSRVQTLGEERMRVQCLATGSVVPRRSPRKDLGQFQGGRSFPHSSQLILPEKCLSSVRFIKPNKNRKIQGFFILLYIC